MGDLPLPFGVFFPPFLVLVVFLAKAFRFAVVFVVFVVFFAALALRALVGTFLPDFLADAFLDDVDAGLDAARATVFFGLAGAAPAVLLFSFSCFLG